ncbi:MAG: Rrf2 family transcriptional regulator [Azospirillaceae bacterium]
MLRLSKKLMFAVEAVLDIAYNAGDQPVQSAEITRRQGIPRRYLEQVLQQLVRDGILSGMRGPRGGYRLARERRLITVGEIVRVIQAMETAGDPIADPAGSELGRSVVRPMWQEVHDECMARLDRVTVDDLCRRAREAGIDREGSAVPDYSI